MLTVTENDKTKINFASGMEEITRSLSDINQYLIENKALEAGIAVIIDIDPLYEVLISSYLPRVLFSVDLMITTKFSPKISGLSRNLPGIISTKRLLAWRGKHVAVIPVTPTKAEMDISVQAAIVNADIYITIRKCEDGFSLTFNKVRKIQDIDNDPVLNRPFYFK